MESPPVKPPRGVKPAKEIGGLLMSVIRTLSSSENNEQRDKEKSKLEYEYRICDQKLEELVLKHEGDLTKARFLFTTISQIVSENRGKIAKVKENLQDCKKKLHCRKDELRNLWMEGLQYKYMIQLLEKIEKMNQVPNRLNEYMNNKQYLHATQLLVEAVTLEKDTLEGVESLKELSQELEKKKELLHFSLISKLKEHLFARPAQNVLALKRQESGRDFFGTPLQRDAESRLSARNRLVNRKLFDTWMKTEPKSDSIEEDLKVANPEENSAHFVSILVECLALLDKLPMAIHQIQNEMQVLLETIVQRTTQHVNDFGYLQNDVDCKQALIELIQTLFEQFREVAEAHGVFLSKVEQCAKKHGATVKPYNLHFFWTHVQISLEALINDYLDNQNAAREKEVLNTTNVTDLSSFFGLRKPPIKKKTLFKFDNSSSALTLSDTIKQTKNENKILICQPNPNNILVLFRPCMDFVEDLEQVLGPENGYCQLHRFLTDFVSNTYLKQKSEAIIDSIEGAVQLSDAWKATVLLDSTADYKPLLVSTVTVEGCIKDWHSVLEHLPIYSERIAIYSCKALKEYKQAAFSTYYQIVQPADRRICSATWLKDEDISRFLKSLPNWLNLKAQQEYHARTERVRRSTALRRDQRSEEESPEDIRQRNRREAEILASNLGEGGVGANEIISDMNLLKELAQLQESMEWFSVRMLQYASLYRKEPNSLSPSKPIKDTIGYTPVPANVLQQLTGIAQEFDELANTCLLLLHLEVRVQCFHYLLAQTHHNRETHEPDPKVLELSRVLANVDEAMTSSLQPRKCKYIFEGLGHLIAKILISSAQYLKVIDEGGIQRMCRNIFALQQTLTNITMTREIALDHARHYFELFFMTPEEILNEIGEKGAEFSELEYMNALQLLNRSQTGRNNDTVAVHLERLSDILGEVGMTV